MLVGFDHSDLDRSWRLEIKRLASAGSVPICILSAGVAIIDIY